MKFNLAENITILDRAPDHYKSILHGLPDEMIFSNEGENTWSPYDIVGHLIHGEKTDWVPRAELILNNSGSKIFEPFDRFAQIEDSKGKSLNELLKEFRVLRSENIERLKSMEISAEILEKTGIHPEFGSVTLKQLLATWVVHDFSHINQISRVLAKNYKEEVGPWRAYISII